MLLLPWNFAFNRSVAIAQKNFALRKQLSRSLPISLQQEENLCCSKNSARYAAFNSGVKSINNLLSAFRTESYWLLLYKS